MKYRVSARGILEQNGKILFASYRDKFGEYYTLPGGKQKKGENLQFCLVREFKEETNLDIIPQKLVLVSEYIRAQSDIETWENGIHQVDVIFLCNKCELDQVETITSMIDLNMVGLVWIDKEKLSQYRIFPLNNLVEILNINNATYLLTE